MEVQRKYYPLLNFSPIDSEKQATTVLNKILYNTEIQVFQKNAVNVYKHPLTKQIITAQTQSIQQIRSIIPNSPFINNQDSKPIKGTFDTIRPYSAKIQRVRKIVTSCDSIQHNPKRNQSRTSNSMKNMPFLKTFRSIGNKGKQEKNQPSKYKSKLIPLRNSRQNQQCDKMIDQLRKNKLKAEQYERAKQNFLLSISKQNEQYPKRQSKFVSTMTRKQYTYTYDCQIVQIPKPKQQLKRKSNTLKNTLGTIPKKDQLEEQKSQAITVEFTKQQPKTQLRQYIFNGATDLRPENICPINTYSTKFTVIVEDC